MMHAIYFETEKDFCAQFTVHQPLLVNLNYTLVHQAKFQ